MALEPSILGIRHHGPGSARSVVRSLESLTPDVILVEGPPEADDLIALSSHEQMQPPVALLIYAVDHPRSAVFYPFATFSPEWQAIRFGVVRQIPVRFMDLPQTHRLRPHSENNDSNDTDDGKSDKENSETGETVVDNVHSDPLGHLARSAGFVDGERWWDAIVEQRRQTDDVFAAVNEAMTALRTDLKQPDDLLEQQREAHMRQSIRIAQKDGFGRIAVVCGAWHAPALRDMPPAKQDAQLLKGLSKTRVAATWVPWTHDRLSYFSGYGAGIESPGWYEHLWNHPHGTSIRWLSVVASLMREKGLDASSAHVIEAVRLAEALATIRDRHQPSLTELNEACESVLCAGETTPMRLIHRELIVGQRLGRVPDVTPMVPLQRDLQSLQKSLRMPASAAEKIYDFDLRNDNDRARSHLLHRLNLLGIAWGQTERVTGRKAGTFHEVWRVLWKPEFAVLLIEAGMWGNKVDEAAAAFVRNAAEKASELPVLTDLLQGSLYADLPEAVDDLIVRIKNQSAVSSDVMQLMDALPPLANVARYGDVRQTKVSMVREVTNGLVTRVCIGLPGACSSLDDDAAGQMEQHLSVVHQAIWLLEAPEQKDQWIATMLKLITTQGLHGLIAGKSCRIALDSGSIGSDSAAMHLSQALSVGHEPARCAAWLEGFLKGSGLVLLHDQRLWQLIDEWISQLSPDRFNEVLALLRRTFSTFAAPERRQMGERVRAADQDSGSAKAESSSVDFDMAAAEKTLPLLSQILGFDFEATGGKP